MTVKSTRPIQAIAVGILRFAGHCTGRAEQCRHSVDHLPERVRPRAEAELGPRNLARPCPARDCYLGDFRGLEHALHELATLRMLRFREQESALEMNSPQAWKADGKIHKCSSFRDARTSLLEDRSTRHDYTDGASAVPLLAALCFISAMASCTASTFSATCLATSA